MLACTQNFFHQADAQPHDSIFNALLPGEIWGLFNSSAMSQVSADMVLLWQPQVPEVVNASTPETAQGVVSRSHKTHSSPEYKAPGTQMCDRCIA